MKPTHIVIHHSYSNWGDAKAIDQWHKEAGFRRRDPKTNKIYHIGYHKVICNGYPVYNSWKKRAYQEKWDGKIQQGRPDYLPGAHTKQNGMNRKSLGICLIGNFDSSNPTGKQLEALIDACTRLCIRHGIKTSCIRFHSDFAHYKTCPGKFFIGVTNPWAKHRIQRMVQEGIDGQEND